eukprot:TRINITY_DN5850_c0_g3_i1.p2 TRINITY_DN5850_c0_g3~~TRINITY_DN5850_c0_g3_i1.p2  ORF type:complete len:279 (-),score=90.50 TRINITY_DN5850_c0_g3_i1:82-918(-)
MNTNQSNNRNMSNQYTSSSGTTQPTLQRVSLPTQYVEKPMAVHEEIRREQVEEIQPVINIEKQKTEIHQVTQPLFDREIKGVNVQQRTLPSETMPDIRMQGRGTYQTAETSSVHMQPSVDRVIEKPAIVREVYKTTIIEEIQPILYKETIVPTVIQETKPVYQKIVEGPVYSQQTLPGRDISATHCYSNAPLPATSGQAGLYGQTGTYGNMGYQGNTANLGNMSNMGASVGQMGTGKTFTGTGAQQFGAQQFPEQQQYGVSSSQANYPQSQNFPQRPL